MMPVFGSYPSRRVVHHTVLDVSTATDLTAGVLAVSNEATANAARRPNPARPARCRRVDVVGGVVVGSAGWSLVSQQRGLVIAGNRDRFGRHFAGVHGKTNLARCRANHRNTHRRQFSDDSGGGHNSTADPVPDRFASFCDHNAPESDRAESDPPNPPNPLSPPRPESVSGGFGGLEGLVSGRSRPVGLLSQALPASASASTLPEASGDDFGSTSDRAESDRPNPLSADRTRQRFTPPPAESSSMNLPP